MYILKFKNVETIVQWLLASNYVDSFIDDIKHKTKLSIDRENIVKYLETVNLLDLGLCVCSNTNVSIEAYKNHLPEKVTLIMNNLNEYNLFNRLELINTTCKDCINYICCNFSS